MRHHWLAALVVLSGCGGGSSDSSTPPSCSRAELGKTLIQQATDLSVDTDFTLLVERISDGASVSVARNSSSAVTRYESASTSKWVTAVVILRLVEQGKLSLDDKPGRWIAEWPLAADHPLSAMTLRQLLSFTSGLVDEPQCQNSPIADFANCVVTGVQQNANSGRTPGSVFHYNSLHLQVAGLMAVRAAGVANWTALFRQFQQSTGLFGTSSYDLPSASNPRLAGGMHWTGQEYLDFLRALAKGQLLGASLQAQLLSNQRGNATVLYSPAVAGFGVDWPYGLGNWQECSGSTCTASRYSSPGAYGAYPVLDLGKGYIAMYARQGALGTFVLGKTQVDALTPAINAWASCNNR